MVLDYMQRRTWAEIDMDALRHNYNVLRGITPSSAKICCIIKADAYGHGSVPVARLYESLGADFLAVSNIEEAMTVREAGIKLPMLVLGYTHPSCAEILADNDISQCVYSYEYGKALEEQARKSGVRLKIHLKLDVGMGRIGFILRDDVAFGEALEICRSPYFINEGIFTHFPLADEDEKGSEITKKQFDDFTASINRFKDCGVDFLIRHCSNSAAAVKFPEYSLDMVRLGISLYGVSVKDAGLKNTLSLKTVVSNVKPLKAGDTVGYGSEYVAKSDVVIATLPIGYADGFKRENLQSGTKICINGKLCAITGRICMDQTMVDVTELPDVKNGDEAVIYGSGSSINLEDFSHNNKKIPYETMCEISARVPRAYKENGEIVFIRNSLV